MALNGDQIERYSRQILLPEIGGRGQNKLLACRVRCLGESAILTTAADYLEAAGLKVSRDPAQAADLLLATADVCTAVLGTLPAFFVGESAAAIWYSRRTAANACRDCLRDAVAAVAGAADSAGPAAAGSAVAGAALAVDVIAQVLDMASGDVPSVVAFSRGGRQRRWVPTEGHPCSHRSRCGATTSNQPAVHSGGA